MPEGVFKWDREDSVKSGGARNSFRAPIPAPALTDALRWTGDGVF